MAARVAFAGGIVDVAGREGAGRKGLRGQLGPCVVAMHVLRVTADGLDLPGELEHDGLVGRSGAGAGRVLVCAR